MSVNLISYLRSLIPIIPEQVAIKNETTIIQLTKTEITSWESVGSFVAPKAGIVCINGQASTLNDSCLQVDASSMVVSNFPGWVNSRIHSIIYVGKGQTVNFFAQNMTQLYAYFSPTLGGG